METIESVSNPEAAALLMHPLRRRIVEEAREPVSASEIARRIGEKRQKVNYHLTELADAGLLKPAGERRRRGLMEKLYQATSISYTIDSAALGDLAPDPATFADGVAAGALMALADRATSEIGLSLRQAKGEKKRLATTALEAEIRFSNARQQARFARELTQAVTDVVARFSEPATSRGGHRYRLIAGAYPIPKTTGEKHP